MKKENILGIDVSKRELVIFNYLSQETIYVKNTETDLALALGQYQWDPAKYIVGIESTGDFSLLPMKFFVQQGFIVKLLNPLVTKRFIKATIRKKKTDASDAQAIATMTHYGEGQTITEKELNSAKKTLLRVERKLTAITSDLKRISNSLTIKINQGIDLDNAGREVKSLIEATQKTAKNIWHLAKAEPLDHQAEIIASHPGCGEKLSAIISSEAGDIKRFPSAKQLKAYAGIDPRVIQSGNVDKRGKMTKRGNPNLRQALYLAAFVASNHDPELQEYYQKKRAEGKSHVHATCTVARKLCERIYAIVTQNRLYEVKQLST